MRQMIEIDVPDGYDIDNVLLCTSLMGDDNRDQFYRVQFKKKGPEFIEVREYLAKVDAIGVRYRVDTRFHIVRPIYIRLKI